MNEVILIYEQGNIFFPVIKKDESTSLAAKWMQLEIIISITHIRTNIIYFFSH